MHFARACEISIGDIIAIKEDCVESLEAVIYLEIENIKIYGDKIEFSGILHIETHLEQENYCIECYRYDQVLVLNS